MKRLTLTLSLASLAITAQAAGDSAHQGHVSKYAGEESRIIKSLSRADIEELRAGGGWGLARAAELNGMPGPAHLLEMKNEISLSEDQVSELTEIFNRMNRLARNHGEILIRLESELETGFRERTITNESLRRQLQAIGQVRSELRYIHLSAHLETPEILTQQQITRYNSLRGYAGSDPCANVPKGHDAAMWRKHNGCD